uniref:GH18 domain-containing protein n=1 Tax=Ditylenchus dipsaci TaxID=166011 RepID=A0A915DJ10_9BILA
MWTGSSRIFDEKPNVWCCHGDLAANHVYDQRHRSRICSRNNRVLVKRVQKERPTLHPAFVATAKPGSTRNWHNLSFPYPAEEITGVAPIRWVEANIRYFLQIAEGNGLPPTKLLIGLNWYGYDRTGGGSDAIIGNKFIELLSDPFTNLEFDDEAGENRIKWGRDGIAYFPTIKSIQLRLQLANQLGIAGIAIWELGQGLDHFTSVL